MIKTILFDLDGTLVRTTSEGRYSIIRTVLKKLTTQPVSDEMIDAFWFGAYRNEIIKNEFKVDQNSFWRIYWQVHTAELTKQHSMPYDDSAILQTLKEKGFVLAVVTGATPLVAACEIDFLGSNLFDAIILARESHGSHPKPDPHCLNLCLEKLNIQAKEAVYVGNADEDILTARAAGVLDIIVDRNECPLLIKPSILLGSLEELPEVVERINGH